MIQQRALVSITILQQVTIRDGAELVPGIDPAADEISRPTTTSAGPAWRRRLGGCTSTQRAANLIVAPNTPTNVREAAMKVIGQPAGDRARRNHGARLVAPRIAMGQRDNLPSACRRCVRAPLPDSAPTDPAARPGVPISLSALPGVLHADDESAANEEKRTARRTRSAVDHGTIGRGER